MSLNDYPKWAEDLTAAVRAVKAATDRIVAADRELAIVEMSLTSALAKLHADRVTSCKEIGALLDRCRRMRELQNMKEIGGFMISVDHAMQSAWQKLP